MGNAFKAARMKLLTRDLNVLDAWKDAKNAFQKLFVESAIILMGLSSKIVNVFALLGVKAAFLLLTDAIFVEQSTTMISKAPSVKYAI